MAAGINNGLNGTIADSLTFGNEFPIANIDQASQQFRDNFKILQVGVENIQGKNIQITGDVVGSALIDSGSTDVSISTTLINGLRLTGGTMTGNLILNSDPSLALQAATKQYVDAHAGGVDVLDDASAVISSVTLFEFGTGLNVIDQSGGQVTINSTALVDPMTTRGDIIYRDSGNTTERLPVGTNTYVLTSDGTDVSWTAPGFNILDDASAVISNVTLLEFGTDLGVVDQGGGQVTINFSGTPSISILDDSSTLIQNVDQIQFGNNLVVINHADGSIRVDSIDVSSISVSNSDSSLVTDVETINFGNFLDVTNDGGNQITVDANIQKKTTISVWVPGLPTDGANVGGYIFDKAVSFQTNFANSVAYADTAPTSNQTWNIQKNGANIGTIDWSAATNAAGFTLASPILFSIGDRLSIIAAATADATHADIMIALQGDR